MSNNSAYRKKSDEYFSQKFIEYGTIPQGVDWNSIASQETRFEQILKIIPENTSEFTINDLGCGYGALVPFLAKKFPQSKFSYTGYDVSDELIKVAQANAKENPIKQLQTKFVKIYDEKCIETSDYTVASGIFNKKFTEDDQSWLEYILTELQEVNKKSRLGFSFNLLTSYSDQDKKKSDLYYADPTYIFDFCKKNFSRNVALLHDYDLYDFTILVRKKWETK